MQAQRSADSHDPRTGVTQLLTEQRPSLLRFAAQQLPDPELAEDVVQETQLAAIEAAGRYSGRASRRTWLFAILRRKIADAHRARARDVARSAIEPHDIEPEEPGRRLEHDQLLDSVAECASRLPPSSARAFLLRDLLGLDTPEICRRLGISASYCWVLLHRARRALRQCLEHMGLGKE